MLVPKAMIHHAELNISTYYFNTKENVGAWWTNKILIIAAGYSSTRSLPEL